MFRTARDVFARFARNMTCSPILTSAGVSPGLSARLRLDALEPREVPAIFAVNSPADFGDANHGNGSATTGNMILVQGQMVPEVTLRSAIEEANALPSSALNPHIITFAAVAAEPPVEEGSPPPPPPSPPRMTIALTGPLPNIHQFIEVNGPGQDKLTITRAANANGFTFFRVGTQPAAPDCSLTLHGMTILGADATGGAMTEGGAVKSNRRLVLNAVTFHDNHAKFGGAVHSSGMLSAANCTFTQNKGEGAGSDGGAIFIAGGVAALNTCNFTENSAVGKGGAIAFNGISQLNLVNTNFYRNSADRGGAIYSSVAGGAVKFSISGGVYDGNTAGRWGGALNLATTDTTITAATFHNNSAARGGVIYTELNALTITNSTFGPNTATILGPLIAYDGILDQSVFIILGDDNTGIAANDLIRDPG